MLNIQNLTVQYHRKDQAVTAVRDFSLTLEPGQTVGIVGESGSGKSTVALAILRLIRPQEGRIVSGQVIFHDNNLLTLSEDDINAVRGKKISMIFQDPFTALNPVMRIREQMSEVGPPPEAAGDDGLNKILSLVQLDPVRILNSYPHQLSGGQRQRVLIAMALMNRPEILIADEPTTALDVLVQKEILELLFGLQKELGMGLLFISHNLGLVATYTTRIVVMKEGRIVETGSPRDLFGSPREPYTKELIASLPPMTRGRPS